MSPGAADFALGVGRRCLRPPCTCDEASPRPTDGEDTQGRPLLRFRAFSASRALTGHGLVSGALTGHADTAMSPTGDGSARGR